MFLHYFPYLSLTAYRLKKLAAISFLLVLTFNWLGYRFVFDHLEQKQDRLLESKLDLDEYDESDLLSIKAHFPAPYFVASNQDQFERWNGEVEINGVMYKYVKRRFFSDSVEFLCIPNTGAELLKEARHDYFRIANDIIPTESNKGSDQKAPVFKNHLSEYCEDIPKYDFTITNKQKHTGMLCSSYLPVAPMDVLSPPPETIS